MKEYSLLCTNLQLNKDIMKIKFALLALVITLGSCGKEKFFYGEKQEELTLNGKRKIFSSAVDLNNYFDTFKRDSIKFRSSDDADFNTPVMTLVEDAAGASIFNENGEVTVADITYKITNVGTFYAKNEDFQKVAHFIEKDITLRNKLQQEDDAAVPEILYVNKPDLSKAVLVDEKLNIYRLAEGVFFKDGIEDTEENELDADKNSMLSGGATPMFRSTANNYNIPDVFDGLSFSNAITKEFTDKNGEVLNNFGKKDRLVVQIKSKNFVIFSYMKTVVRIDHKKSLWFGWRTLQNYDDLRAGFVNLVLDFDLPHLNDAFLNQGKAPDPIDNGVNPYLKTIGNVSLDDDYFDLYRLTDVLRLPDLPFNLRGQIENLLESPESFYSNILNQQKNQLVSKITNYMKTKIDPMVSKNNFSFVIPQNNSLVTVPLLEKRKTSRGAIIELKEVQTAIVSIKSNGNNTSVGGAPSKNPKIISGAIFGAGKLNGQWKTGVLVKNKK